MKHAKLLSSIGVIVLVGIIIGVRFSKRNTVPQPQLPSPDSATLAGPQTPIPASAFNPTIPLSKNRIIIKNNMKIEVTKEGTGEKVVNGDTAVVEYVGKLENGTVFDASKNHGDGSFSFSVGAGQVIKGWDQGVLNMKIGESRTLTIPPELAYGPNGIPPVIPANATLIFEVTLLAIK
jgi:FKBP-type peptidyl-prolyl cis-trans isomerase